MHFHIPRRSFTKTTMLSDISQQSFSSFLLCDVSSPANSQSRLHSINQIEERTEKMEENETNGLKPVAKFCLDGVCAMSKKN